MLAALSAFVAQIAPAAPNVQASARDLPTRLIVERSADLGFTYREIDPVTNQTLWSFPRSAKPAALSPTGQFLDVAV
ncbi:MAG: hypothetical protein ABUS57_00425 [Pseudomonadota bacterium]